jgi:hypothetical protein
MKLTTTVLTLATLLGSANAFTTTSSIGTSNAKSSALPMADRSFSEDERSYSVPFVKQNKLLDGKYGGDAQFDPLFLADNEELLFNYREAEIKVRRQKTGLFLLDDFF